MSPTNTPRDTSAVDPFADLAAPSPAMRPAAVASEGGRHDLRTKSGHDPFADLDATSVAGDPFADLAEQSHSSPGTVVAEAAARAGAGVGSVIDNVTNSPLGRFAGDYASRVGENVKQAVTHPVETAKGIAPFVIAEGPAIAAKALPAVAGGLSKVGGPIAQAGLAVHYGVKLLGDELAGRSIEKSLARVEDETPTIKEMRGRGYSDQQIRNVLAGTVATEQSISGDLAKTSAEGVQNAGTLGGAGVAALVGPAAAGLAKGAFGKGLAGGAAGLGAFQGGAAALERKSPREVALEAATGATIGAGLGAAAGPIARKVTPREMPTVETEAPITTATAPASEEPGAPSLSTPQQTQPIPQGLLTTEEKTRAVPTELMNAEREPTPRPLAPKGSVQSALQEQVEQTPEYKARVRELSVGAPRTDDELRAAAAANPMTVEELSGWRAGAPATAVDQVRATNLRNDLWQDMASAVDPKNGEPDLDAFLAAQSRAASIEPGFNTITGAAGRELHARQINQQGADAAVLDQTKHLAELLEDLDKVGATDAQKRAAVEAHLRAQRGTLKTLFSKVSAPAAYWGNRIINGMVTNLFDPITVLTKGTADTFLLGVRGLERTVQAGGYAARGALQDLTGDPVAAARARADAAAAIDMRFGLGQAFRHGLNDYWETVQAASTRRETPTHVAGADTRTGTPWSELNQAQKLNRFRSVTQQLHAIATAMGTVHREAEINLQASRIANREVASGALKPEDRGARLAELTRSVERRNPETGQIDRQYPNLPARMVEAADAVAREMTMMEGSNGTDRDVVMKAISSIQKIPFMRLFLPVARIGYNIERLSARRDPVLGLASRKNWGDFSAQGYRQAEALSRYGAGLLLAGGVYGIMQNQHVNGAYPKDPRERALWQQEGRVPFSIWWGGTWVKINKLPVPVNTFFMKMIALHEAFKKGDADNAHAKVDELFRQLGSGALDLPFISDIAGVVKQITDPAPSGWSRIGKSLAGMAVPAWVRDIRNVTDKTVRQADTVGQAIENSIPGLSQNVPPKITALGDVQKLADTFPWGWTKQISEPRSDAETNELRRLNWSPAMPETKFIVKDSAMPTQEEIDKKMDNAPRLTKFVDMDAVDPRVKSLYLNDMGLAAREAIRRSMGNPQYAKASDAKKIEALKKSVAGAQRAVRTQYRSWLGITPGGFLNPDLREAHKSDVEARVKAGVVEKQIHASGGEVDPGDAADGEVSRIIKGGLEGIGPSALRKELAEMPEEALATFLEKYDPAYSPKTPSPGTESEPALAVHAPGESEQAVKAITSVQREGQFEGAASVPQTASMSKSRPATIGYMSPDDIKLTEMAPKDVRLMKAKAEVKKGYARLDDARATGDPGRITDAQNSLVLLLQVYNAALRSRKK